MRFADRRPVLFVGLHALGMIATALCSAIGPFFSWLVGLEGAVSFLPAIIGLAAFGIWLRLAISLFRWDAAFGWLSLFTLPPAIVTPLIAGMLVVSGMSDAANQFLGQPPP